MTTDLPAHADEMPSPQQKAMWLLQELQVFQMELDSSKEQLIAARRELETEKARYLQLYDGSPTGNLNLQRSGAIVHCNLAAARTLHTARNQLVGQSFNAFIGKNDQPVFADCLAQVFSTSTTAICTVALVTGHAKPRWLQCVIALAPHSDECILVLVDDPQVQHTQQSLADVEQRWELAVRGTHDGLWDWSPHTHQVFYSDRLKWMLGYAPHELGDDVEVWQSRVHPGDSQRVTAELVSYLAGKSAYYESEFRLRCKDGAYKQTLSRGQASFNAAGRVLRMVGSLSDISERRDAEARVNDRNAQLDVIFALSPDAFVSFDREMRVKFANPSFVRMTGFPETGLIGLGAAQFCEQLSSLCRADACFAGLAALMAKHQTSGSERPQPTPADTKDPVELMVMADASQRILKVCLRSSDAETVSQILYFRDVTQDKAVERLKSDFLSTVAHELRTPMAGVFGYAEMLLAHKFTAQEQRKYIKIIHKQSGLMTDILNELLDLSRIEARRGQDLKLTTLDACALINEVIFDIKVPAGRKRPTFEATEAPYWFSADRGKIIQALNNVLSNAYKYSPSGGAIAVALIRERRADQAACVGIRISDSGRGMSPEHLTRIFERFYRVDASGSIPGTGLGMSIVKEIIELHSGHIEINSTLGAGTSVTMWIPTTAR